jgi:hypothetical protein
MSHAAKRAVIAAVILRHRQRGQAFNAYDRKLPNMVIHRELVMSTSMEIRITETDRDHCVNKLAAVFAFDLLAP